MIGNLRGRALLPYCHNKLTWFTSTKHIAIPNFTIYICVYIYIYIYISTVDTEGIVGQAGEEGEGEGR